MPMLSDSRLTVSSRPPPSGRSIATWRRTPWDSCWRQSSRALIHRRPARSPRPASPGCAPGRPGRRRATRHRVAGPPACRRVRPAAAPARPGRRMRHRRAGRGVPGAGLALAHAGQVQRPRQETAQIVQRRVALPVLNSPWMRYGPARSGHCAGSDGAIGRRGSRKPGQSTGTPSSRDEPQAASVTASATPAVMRRAILDASRLDIMVAPLAPPAAAHGDELYPNRRRALPAPRRGE